MTTPFGRWFKERYKKLGMTQEVLAGLMGVTQGTVSRWANGGDLTADRIPLLASLLQVSIEHLVRRIGGEEVVEGRWIDEDQAGYEWVPITGAAAAGQDRSVSSDDYVILPRRHTRRYPGRRQSLEVRGDCLAPEIAPGSQVVVDPDLPWRPGQRIALKANGGVHVKILVSLADGRLVLTSNHGELVLPDSDARILGVVIASQRFFEV